MTRGSVREISSLYTGAGSNWRHPRKEQRGRHLVQRLICHLECPYLLLEHLVQVLGPLIPTQLLGRSR